MNREPTVESLLEADDYRFERLMESDVAALDKLLTDDFTYTHNAGFTDLKADYLGRIASGGVFYSDGQRVSHSTRVHGNTGIMTGHMLMVANVPDAAIQLDNVFLAVWVFGDDGWKLAAWSSTTRQG